MIVLDNLPLDRLPALRPLLRAPCPLEAAYALEAMIVGHLTCQAWADDSVSPTLAYLWDGGALHYVLGARTPAAEAAIAALFTDSIAPAARVASAYYVKLHSAEPGWDDWLPPVPGARRSERVAYLLDAALALEKPVQVAEGYRLVEIDAALLADETLDMAAAHDEIASCWPSVELFHEQGFGYGVLAGRELVAWCTAELVSPGRCGVGIETVEAHQRRGLATATASAFARRCRQEGRVALWDAWAGNAPSRRTGEKAGWALAEEYTVAFAVLEAEAG
jgi:GNAT superfamily N-acetyltransferase